MKKRRLGRSLIVGGAALVSAQFLIAGLVAAAPADDPRYQQPWRPQFHYSQPDQFMNDPNGLVYYDGTYHLHFQQRGYPGGIAWGQAKSSDLLHWENVSPTAIPGAGGISIFSGSAVVDYENTSGLGTLENPPLVAIYTGSGLGRQTQNLAFSLDKGETWTKYAGNPVIDLGLSQFRDPNVFWYEPTERWIMSISLSSLHQMAIFSSPDLKNWTLESRWGPMVQFDGQWEVPALLPLKVDGDEENVKWVMIVSTNPGGQYGGSGTFYVVGDFDGREFTPDPERYDYSPPVGEEFADFEGGEYGPGWTTSGTSFGSGPRGPRPDPFVPVQGITPLYLFLGDGMVDSLYQDDATTTNGTATGTLTSPTFTITRPYINMLVAGTNNANNQIQLLVDDSTVRTQNGNGQNAFDWRAWDVSDLIGQTAQIRVVDNTTSATQFIALDHVMFADAPATRSASRADWLDWGKDNYAGIQYNNLPDDRTLFVAWMNNWQYAQSNNVPTTPNWRGIQSEPRELTLATIDEKPQIVQAPLAELDTLHAEKKFSQSKTTIEDAVPIVMSASSADIEVEFTAGTASEFGLELFAGGSQRTVIGYDTTTQRVYIDRTASGAGANLNGFLGVHSAPLALSDDGKLRMRILIDESLVEVFADEGHIVLSDLVYPDPSSRGIRAFAEGGAATLDKLTVTPMLTTWFSTGIGEDVVCSDQELNGGTYGDVTVPDGAWCHVNRVTVTGDIYADGANGIGIVNSTVLGNVHAVNTRGSANPMSSGGNVICNTTVSKNLHVQGSSADAPWNIGACGQTLVGGNLLFVNNLGSLNTITATMVNGNLQCIRNRDISVSEDSTVGGNRLGQCATL